MFIVRSGCMLVTDLDYYIGVSNSRYTSDGIYIGDYAQDLYFVRRVLWIVHNGLSVRIIIR